MNDPGITVFSSPLCGPCERMKAWLAERNYPFTVRDVMMDEAAGELLESHDIRTTPALLVGDTFVIGLDIAAMEAALADWIPPRPDGERSDAHLL